MVAYHRPPTLDEALAIRAERPVTVLAGGTDVYPAKAARAGWGDMRHADMLDISAVPGLRGIAEERERLAHRRAHDLDRPDPRRAAAAVRRPEARRARGRRRADPEPRHARRQPLHRLAGRRRRAQPAGARRRGRAGEPAGPPRRAAAPTSSTAIATPRCRADEIVTAHPRAEAARATRAATSSSSARARYLVISIVMAAGVVETDADGTHRRGAARRRRLLGRSPQRLPALEAALRRRSRSTAAADVVAAGASRAARADRRHPRLGRLPAARRRWR